MQVGKWKEETTCNGGFSNGDFDFICIPVYKLRSDQSDSGVQIWRARSQKNTRFRGKMFKMISPTKFFHKTFYLLGWKIAEYPKTAITVPILISMILACGILRLEVNNDFERLYTTTVGPSVDETQFVLKYFRQNETGRFDPSRKSSLGEFLR